MNGEGTGEVVRGGTMGFDLDVEVSLVRGMQWRWAKIRGGSYSLFPEITKCRVSTSYKLRIYLASIGKIRRRADLGANLRRVYF